MSETCQVQALSAGQRIILYGQAVTVLRYESPVPGFKLGYLWFQRQPNATPRRVSRRPDARVRLAS